MSIKPSVVFIKGVHSTTGSDKTSDIGFPQLELEKLFEGATLKKVGSGDTYSSGKKYIYYDPSNSQVVIQNGGHFNCIKNGYYSIADGVMLVPGDFDHSVTGEKSQKVTRENDQKSHLTPLIIQFPEDCQKQFLPFL